MLHCADEYSYVRISVGGCIWRGSVNIVGTDVDSIKGPFMMTLLVLYLCLCWKVFLP